MRKCPFRDNWYKAVEDGQYYDDGCYALLAAICDFFYWLGRKLLRRDVSDWQYYKMPFDTNKPPEPPPNRDMWYFFGLLSETKQSKKRTEEYKRRLAEYSEQAKHNNQ